VELLLIRHALPVRIERADGRVADPGLAARGHEQAAQLAEWLAREPIAALYTSPLRRARETATPLAQRCGLTAQIVPDLAEFARQSSAYVPLEEIKAAEPERWRALVGGELYAGVDLGAFRARVGRALEAIVRDHPGERAAVVCHGGVVNAWAAEVLGLGPTLFFEPGYASISRFLAARSGARGLRSLGESAHLGPGPR
jgi:2,3-bisphosphoglycerate-dependent phosphoglycerate mutase